MSRLIAACVLGFCVLLCAGRAAAASPRELPGLAPAPRDALTRALDAGRLTEATYALARARTLFALAEVRDEFGPVAAPPARSATAILRDLVARAAFLSGRDRAEARAILARPGATDTACDVARSLCFHWSTGGRHAASPQDVNETIDAFAAVWDLEVGTYGYRPPLPDSDSPSDGGSAATDIYLRDLGRDRPLFGFCTTDDPDAARSYRYSDISAYCVVDNDFSPAQFGTSQRPEDFRDVTAAHEFFHAIQFAYDWLEDLWLMEGTAMLMEGQFRPDVDDRIRYLADSALASPATPVDRGADGFEYGAWIYWRFLVEQFGELADPLVIRQIWERTAGASVDTDGPGPDTVANDPYSLAATRRVLAARGGSFPSLFAKFTRVNRAPATFYEEGASYPAAGAAGRETMSAGEATGWRSTELRHLASESYTFKRAASLPDDARLRLEVNLPKRRYGPEARLLVRLAIGDFRRHAIGLDAGGRGARSVAFGPGVRQVDLVLTNASTRMRCDRDTPYSCAGVGVDDLRRYSYRASAR
jgi:hypothetical protein